MHGGVGALAVSGGTLYAGGYFATAGGNAANNIAQWNGSSWSALGSGIGGINPIVNALAVSGGTLYAGGGFTTAGTNISAYVAKAVLNFPPAALVKVSPLFVVSPDDTTLFILSPNNINATVVLDGSQSSDADNDPLQFSWYADGQTDALATRAVTTNVFPIGPHTVTLIVSDGHDTATAQVSFEVITPATAVGQLLLLVDDAQVGRLNKQPLLATLLAAMSSFERGDVTAALNQLSAFQSKLRAQAALLSPSLVNQLTTAAQQIIGVARVRPQKSPRSTHD
jgi:hypothetical protein